MSRRYPAYVPSLVRRCPLPPGKNRFEHKFPVPLDRGGWVLVSLPGPSIVLVSVYVWVYDRTWMALPAPSRFGDTPPAKVQLAPVVFTLCFCAGKPAFCCDCGGSRLAGVFLNGGFGWRVATG